MHAGKHLSRLFAPVLTKPGILLAVSTLSIGSFLPSSIAQVSTVRISVATDGTQGNADSGNGLPSVSADGRYVAFYSDASNLVADDTNGCGDAFVRDTVLSKTTRVSVASDGPPGNGMSIYPSISADGRYVAFQSSATNLVYDDVNGVSDVFLRDTEAGTTIRVSVSSNGAEGNASSFSPTISSDGRYVAFYSAASNLAAEDTNGKLDVFVRDTVAGTTVRISVASDGSQGDGDSSHAAISADGRFVGFDSTASNLVPGDSNGVMDVFLRDTVAGTTSRLSLAPDGTQGNGMSVYPSVSADGRYVVFSSSASNLVAGDTNGVPDIFVRDTVAGTTARVSVATDGTQGNGPSQIASVSADGRYVALMSLATNLVTGDTNGAPDIFVRDTAAGTTDRVSVASDGTQANASSALPAISADGKHVVFLSDASNLVPDDSNGHKDVFLSTQLIPSSFTATDVAQCMRIAAGLATPAADDTTRYNLATGNAAITLEDAVCIARKVAGLEANQ